ncbi:VPLPA-CTERM sorting domain-containing protein [Desulfococcaceae bacterium HSG8]|nr:VPLPA-CTERM sorting domain-containing protein [Desulfococcaceae bacterium HSG8]
MKKRREGLILCVIASVIFFTNQVWGTVLYFDPSDSEIGIEDMLDVGGSFVFCKGNVGSSMINLSEVSWENDLSPQSDSFTLETISFTEDSLGNSDLMFSGVTLGDFNGDLFSAELETGNVSVVPIPGAVWLLGSGLVGIVGFRRNY